MTQLVRHRYQHRTPAGTSRVVVGGSIRGNSNSPSHVIRYLDGQVDGAHDPVEHLTVDYFRQRISGVSGGLGRSELLLVGLVARDDCTHSQRLNQVLPIDAQEGRDRGQAVPRP